MKYQQMMRHGNHRNSRVAEVWNKIIMSDLSWHQTKSITITIITLLITNIVSSVWWAASITTDVDALKTRPDLLERVIRVETIAEQNTRYYNRLSLILDKVNANMDRIDREQVLRASTIKRVERHLQYSNDKK